MDFQFDDCAKVLFAGLFEAIQSRADDIRLLNKSEPLWAISYDLIPWDPYVGIAFRLESESHFGASENSADWKNSHFIETRDQPALKLVEDYINRVSEDSNDRSHLVFLAGAVALLDQRIAQLLRSLGIDAPIVGDQLCSSYFQYFVFDTDGIVRSNYCDIVRASRATTRLLGRCV